MKIRAASIAGLAAAAFAVWAGPLGSAPARAETVFDAPFDPADCGERLIALYDGRFDVYWNFVRQQGYTGVPEFAWSAPQQPDESNADWQARALQCLLEVERANRRDESVGNRYALGHFLWFGTTSLGFEKTADGSPGVRERGYRYLRSAAEDGDRGAVHALIQAHMEMVQLIDQRFAYAGKADTEARIPDWWPERDAMLRSLDQLAKSGYPEAYLAVAAIFSERALLARTTGHDHQGRAVRAPDPRLEEAAEAYRAAYERSRPPDAAPES